MAKSTDLTKIIITHRGGVDLRQAEVSVVVYAQQNGVRYIDFAINAEHTFETYGHYEIDNTIDLEKLKVDPSPYIVDGSVHVKVFIRPITFQNSTTGL